MLVDRDISPTSIEDAEFNILAAIFLDGRPAITVTPELRAWPRTSMYWNADDKPIQLKELTVLGEHKDRLYTHKLVVGREDVGEVVWCGAMPDQFNGFTKGELLGQEGYEGSATAGMLDRFKLYNIKNTPSSQWEKNVEKF